MMDNKMTVVGHLSELFRLTGDPKYLLDVSNVLMNSPYFDDKKNGVEMLFQVSDSFSIDDMELSPSVKPLIEAKLNRKTVKNLPIAAGENVSVIIPTMWKCHKTYFDWNLSELNCFNFTDVKIIDNNPVGNYYEVGEENSDRSYSRVKVIKQLENIGVNKAWNLGVADATHPYYCLLNDDCLVSITEYKAAVNILETDESVGLVVFRTKQESLQDFDDSREVLSETEYIDIHGRFMGGWCMVGRVSEYIPIPEELLFFYGDNFIYDTLKARGKRIVGVNNSYVSHALSTTVKDLDLYRKGLLESEGKIYKKILENIKSYI